MKTYNIYKKRDGQSFELINEIYASDFTEAKKTFAKNMTEDNHSKSNNIVLLSKDDDGVDVTGWYDFNGTIPTFDEETETYNSAEAADCLLVSQEDIDNGFEFWVEDVYQWVIIDNLDYVEIKNMDEFENEKEDYSYFMKVEQPNF